MKNLVVFALMCVCVQVEAADQQDAIDARDYADMQHYSMTLEKTASSSALDDQISYLSTVTSEYIAYKNNGGQDPNNAMYNDIQTAGTYLNIAILYHGYGGDDEELGDQDYGQGTTAYNQSDWGEAVTQYDEAQTNYTNADVSYGAASLACEGAYDLLLGVETTITMP